MKRIILLTCVGSILLASPAWSAPNKSKAVRRPAPHAVATRGGGGASMHRAAPIRTVRSYPSARMNSGRVYNANPRLRSRSDMAVNRSRNINRSNALRNNRAGVTERNANMINRSRVNPNNSVVTRGANVNRAIAAQNRAGNARIVNNWRSNRFSGQDYAAFRDYHRQWHNQSWWRDHYSRIILVSGGWWFWDAGYWYPAWGYDPYYTYYPYDGPIYGYGDLTPDRIIVNVQAQLRDDGYYAGAVDGVLGSQTRRAIAAFQADHGLAVTSGVDEPTLATLGLS